MRQVLFAVSLIAACSSVAIVAQSRFLSDSPGTWKPWAFRAYADHRRVLGAGPAAVREVEAQLLRLNAIIKNTPGITNPIGFSVETSGDLGLGNDGLAPRAGEPALTARPFPASMGFGAFPVTEYGSGATAKRDDTGETPHVYFHVNDLWQPLTSTLDSRVPEFDKLDADVVRLAAPQPDVFGLPRYGNTLVLKKSAAPIWAAVPFSETLDLVAKTIELRLVDERGAAGRIQAVYDEMTSPAKRDPIIALLKTQAAKSKDPAYMDKAIARMDRETASLLPQITAAKAVVAKSEQDLAGVRTMAAGLSAADKAAPACYASSDKVSVSRFRRAPAAGCEPLVRANWKLFNPALPRTAPQVLVITAFDRCLSAESQAPHAGGCRANVRLLESIDKAALMAWLQ
jgi:hypothetical protein